MAITDNIGQGQAALKRFFKAMEKLGNTRRFKQLTRRRAHYCGEQYDHLRYDFDHYPISELGDDHVIGQDAPETIPMKLRRPCVQAGFPTKIVNTFTDLLFSERLFPRVKSSDENTQKWINKLIEESMLSNTMSQARNFGGSMGSVAMAVKSYEQDLVVEVLDTRHLFVVEWAEKHKQIPKIVIEQYEYTKEEIDEDGRFVERKRLVQRVWTDKVEEHRESKPIEAGSDQIEWDDETVVEHGLSRCPVVWICNTPPDKGEVDGDADYPDQLFSTFREIDYLYSTMTRAFKANMDPTAVFVGVVDGWFDSAIQTGSSNVIRLNPGSEAKFLEPTFSGYDQALEFFSRLTRNVKNSTDCLTFEVDAAIHEAPSGVALERMLAPMFTRAGKFRKRYGFALIQVLQLAIEIDGKVISNDVIDGVVVATNPLGLNVGEDLKLGTKTDISLSWPPFVVPTPDEVEKIARTAISAKGQVSSTKTAVTSAANAFGVEDVDAEIAAIEKEQTDRQKRMDEGFEDVDEDDVE